MKLITKNKIFIFCIIVVILLLLFIFVNKKDTEYFTLDEYKYIHDILIQNLEKTIQIFEKHGIKYWAIGGTLLGSIRNKNLIDKDDDIDLGLLKRDFLKIQNNENNIINDLNDVGLHLIKTNGFYQNKIVSKREDNDYTKNKIFIDIMGYDMINNKYNWLYPPHRKLWPNSWYYEHELFPLKKNKIKNLDINIPNKPINYLKRAYGDCNNDKCWKIPTNERPYHKGEINLKL